jgi:hypothetical protein
MKIPTEKLLAYIAGENAKKLSFYVGAAKFDLYFGPRGIDECDIFPWLGFAHATKEIRALIDDKTVYYDNDCGGFLDKMPEGEYVDGEYIEPSWEEIYEVDVKKELCGAELAPYI